MDADWIDSHDLYTTVRASWASHLSTPGTQYGIADALGEDATHTVFSRPAFAAV